jgi:hypothetical protein
VKIIERKVRMHSHTVQFYGSEKTYPFSTVDFFDGTCPICEALAAGKEPTCVFVQPAPGAHQTYLSSGERLHRRLADLALHLPGRLNPYRVR